MGLGHLATSIIQDTLSVSSMSLNINEELPIPAVRLDDPVCCRRLSRQYS